MPKVPVRVAVTGAAGQIGYSLLFRIAAGEMLGRDQPMILQMLEIPDEKAQKALKGVMMELDDCAFPLLQGMSAAAEPEVAFRDVDIALLVGARPRRSRHGAQGPARGERQDFRAAGPRARQGRQAGRESSGRRQPGEHQLPHRDEKCAGPEAGAIHRHDAPRP